MYYLIKSFLLVIFITLCWFSWLQFNDPDAPLWIFIYGIAALVPLFGLFGKTSFVFSMIVAIICLTALLVNIPGYYTYWLHHHDEALMQSMNPDKPYIEEAREFLGSLIALLLVASSHYIGKCKTNTSP